MFELPLKTAKAKIKLVVQGILRIHHAQHSKRHSILTDIDLILNEERQEIRLKIDESFS